MVAVVPSLESGNSAIEKEQESILALVGKPLTCYTWLPIIAKQVHPVAFHLLVVAVSATSLLFTSFRPSTTKSSLTVFLRLPYVQSLATDSQPAG